MIELSQGAEALARLRAPEFVARWQTLAAEANASLFLTPGFVLAMLVGKEPLLALEAQAGRLTGLLVLEPTGDGELVAAGGREARRQGWLSSPLDGSFFVERALSALLERRDVRKIRLERVARRLLIDWASAQRPLGRRCRVGAIEDGLLVLDEARAKKPIEDKTHSPQLAALKALGTLEAKIDAPGDRSAWLASAAEWDDRLCHDQGLQRRFADNDAAAGLARACDAGALRLFTLWAGAELISLISLYLDGDDVIVALAAEPPRHEPLGPGLYHWFLLERWLLEQGKKKVDVSLAPYWLRLMAAEKSTLDVVTVYERRRDMLRDGAEGALIDLSRWAIGRVEG